MNFKLALLNPQLGNDWAKYIRESTLNSPPRLTYMPMNPHNTRPHHLHEYTALGTFVKIPNCPLKLGKSA